MACLLVRPIFLLSCLITVTPIIINKCCPSSGGFDNDKWACESSAVETNAVDLDDEEGESPFPKNAHWFPKEALVDSVSLRSVSGEDQTKLMDWLQGAATVRYDKIPVCEGGAELEYSIFTQEYNYLKVAVERDGEMRFLVSLPESSSYENPSEEKVVRPEDACIDQILGGVAHIVAYCPEA